MIKKILILCILSFSLQLLANEIEFDSYVERTTIGMMDRLQLTLEISGSDANKITAPKLPKIDNFKNLGYTQSSSSSYSFSNGRAVSTITKKYIYSLKPLKTGKFMIPSLQISYKGKVYTTQPITIKVNEGSTSSVPTNGGRQGNTSGSNQVSDNLFMKTHISKQSVYEGEPIIVEYILYSRYDISNLSFGEEAGYQGFWKESLFVPDKINFQAKTENGVRYNTMLMKRLALYPNETGTLEIPALSVNADILTQARSFFDFGSSKSFEVKSKAQKINVKPLPSAPEKFTGAVGKFKVSSKVSTQDLKVGDSFTYTLEITGSGNFKHFDLPKLPDVKYLRFLDPEIDTKMSQNSTTGKKVIKYLVIAQEQGNIEVPSWNFTYFDTKQRKYTTIPTAKFQLTVQPGDLSYIPASSAQTSVTLEGADIGFLAEIDKLESKKTYFHTWEFWLIIMLMLLTLPGSYLYRQEKDKLESNQEYYRNKRANKILKKYMKEATALAGENKAEFYAAAQTGLANYLSDKLHIARGSTTDEIFVNLQQRTITDTLMNDIKEIFAICNQARFMPGGFSSEKISQHHDMIKKIVTELSKIKF